jgi:hypothetical protein
MSKISFEVYDVGSIVFCTTRNSLYRGVVRKYTMYDPGVIKYLIEIMIDGAVGIEKDVPEDCIYESKEQYIDYLSKLEI